jgi:hypothetical protein
MDSSFPKPARRGGLYLGMLAMAEAVQLPGWMRSQVQLGNEDTPLGNEDTQVQFGNEDTPLGNEDTPLGNEEVHKLSAIALLVPKLHLGTATPLVAVALPLLTATRRNAALPLRRVTTRARRKIANAPVRRPSRA